MERHLRSKGFETHAIDFKPSNGNESIEVLAEQVADYVENHLGGLRNFSMVGFSMGSLVSRYYIQKLDGSLGFASIVI